MPAEPPPLLARLATALEPIEAVRIAYLFGSQAQGTARADSDLDIALQLDPTLDESARAALLLDVLDALARHLGPLGERADVLDLGRAAPKLAFHIIRDGQRILFRDRRERVHLEATIARRYDDQRRHHELFRQAVPGAFDGS